MQIKVGALGNIRFKNGFYAYVGSAQRGLKNRINRHLTKIRKRNFWHIDYLLENNYTEILEIFYKIADKSMECKIAQNLNKQTYQITNFGCSDCNCHSHFRF